VDRVLSAWTEALREFVGDDAGRSVLVSGGGRRAGIAEDVARPAASVAKLWIAMAVHDAAAVGELDPSSTVQVGNLPTSRYPSVLDSFEPEHHLTLAEIAGLSLATSDNRTAQHLVDILGLSSVEECARSHGCTRTALLSGFDDVSLDTGRVRLSTTSARDSELAFETVMSVTRYSQLRRSLRSSLFNARILARLPDHIIKSHKSGSLDGVANDVGIVHAVRGDLTLSFLTEDQTDTWATSADIARCSRECFDAWETFR